MQKRGDTLQSTPIWIYNKNEEFLRIIDIQDYDIPHYDSWFTEQLNGAITLEFSIPADHPDAALIENDGRAVIRDKDGELVEFIIRQPQDSNGPNGPEKRVFAEGGDYELIDEWMTGYKQSNVTLQTALEAVTSHTRWKIGHVDDFGTNSVDIKPTTVKNAIVQLLQIFGGQVKYRVEADGNRITRRYIDVYRKRGDFKGKRFETGKDVRTITYTPDSTGIKTALYGYGASGENDGPRLTFADVEWSKANGDPVDKPLGQIWVGDPEALERWGYDGGTRHRFGEYSGQEEDPAELLLNTWNHLQELTNEVRTYELEVALLQDIPGYEHEEVRLGDTVLVIDRELQPNIEVQANIIEYRQNLNDDSLDEVVVGQFRNALDIAGRQRGIEQIIEEKQGNWDKKETPEGALEKANQKAQEAIDEAQQRIEQAKAELEEAMIDLDEAMQIADNVFDDKILNPQNYKGYFEGDVGITGELHVAGTIIGGSGAIIRGTLNAQNLNLHQANILNANIQDATITGTLSSVDGTFTGSLVGVDGTFVGTLITAGAVGETRIESDRIEQIYGDPNAMYATHSKAELSTGGIKVESIYQDPDIYNVNDAVEIKDSTVRGYNNLNDEFKLTPRMLEFAEANGFMVYRIDGGVPITSQQETGFCGVGGRSSDAPTDAAVSGVGVNFRVKKNYTPSSVNLSATSNTANPNVANITRDGFWLFVNKPSDNNYPYWRGYYTC